MGHSLAIFFTLIIVLAGVTGKQCGVGQKSRVTKNGLEVCCKTTICNKSHTFEYCDYDGGSDQCIPCDTGTYTNDPIDTSKLPYGNPATYQEVPDICVVIPSCTGDEVTLVNYQCVCDLDKGFYGTDRYNCRFDQLNCNKAGHQLDINGKCQLCPSHQFKPEDGLYRQCRNRTVCKSNEIVTFHGSPTSNRICEKSATAEPSTTLKPEEKTTVLETVNTEDSSLSDGVIVCIVLAIVLVLAVFFSCIFRDRIKDLVHKCRRRHSRSSQHGHESEHPLISMENQRTIFSVENDKTETSFGPNSNSSNGTIQEKLEQNVEGNQIGNKNDPHNQIGNGHHLQQPNGPGSHIGNGHHLQQPNGPGSHIGNGHHLQQPNGPGNQIGNGNPPQQPNGPGNQIGNEHHPQQPNRHGKPMVNARNQDSIKPTVTTDTDKTDIKESNRYSKPGIDSKTHDTCTKDDDSVKFNSLADSSIFSANYRETMSTMLEGELPNQSSQGNFPSPSLIQSLDTRLPGNTREASEHENVGHSTNRNLEMTKGTNSSVRNVQTPYPASCFNAITNHLPRDASSSENPCKSEGNNLPQNQEETQNSTSPTSKSTAITPFTRNPIARSGSPVSKKQEQPNSAASCSHNSPCSASNAAVGAKTAGHPVVPQIPSSRDSAGKGKSKSHDTKGGNRQASDNQTAGRDKKESPKTTKPVCQVPPMVRTNSIPNQDNSNADQDFPPSNTTANGLDIQQATNEDDQKFVPSHTPRNELEPLTTPAELVVNMPSLDKSSEDGQGMSEETQSSSEGIGDSVTLEEPQAVPNIGNTADTSEEQVSYEGLNTSQLGSNVTSRGHPVCTPASQGNTSSEESSLGTDTSSQAFNSAELNNDEEQRS